LLLYFSVVVNERIAWIELCILFQSYSALVSLSSTLRFVSVLPVHRLLRGPLHHLRTRPNPGGVRRRRNRKHHPLPGLLFILLKWSLIFWEKAPLSYQQKETGLASNYQSFTTSICKKKTVVLTRRHSLKKILLKAASFSGHKNRLVSSDQVGVGNLVGENIPLSKLHTQRTFVTDNRF